MPVPHEVPPQPTVSRILSAFAAALQPRLRRDNHSSSPVITDGIKRPTRKPRTGRSLSALSPGTRASLFGLAPCGVLPATRVTTSAVRSYRTFSPLPTYALRATAGKPARARHRTRPRVLPAVAPEARKRAVSFLCHCPSSCPDRALPGALPCGVRTFLPPSPATRASARQAREASRRDDDTDLSRRSSRSERRRTIVWFAAAAQSSLSCYPSVS